MGAGAERWYRRLLLVLPPQLRREAEADLLAVFRPAYERAAAAGAAARMRFWIWMTADLLAASVAERWGRAAPPLRRLTLTGDQEMTRSREDPPDHRVCSEKEARRLRDLRDRGAGQPVRFHRDGVMPLHEGSGDEGLRRERGLAAVGPGGLVMHLLRFPAGLFTELSQASRRLLRTPGWTLVSSGTLALGLASAIVAWVLVRDVLLKPLPFDEPERLVRMRELSANGGVWWPSFRNAAEWRQHAGAVFDGIGIADVPHTLPVLLEGTAIRTAVARGAHGFFETLGVRPVEGRLFTADESRPGAPAVALVSDAFRRRTLHGVPLDRVHLTIGRDTYSVIGVLPDDFEFLGDGGAWTKGADVWTPLEREKQLGSRTRHGYHVVGRLRRGVTLDAARSAMNDLAAALKAAHAEPTHADAVLVTPLHDGVVARAREPLRLLLFASCAVLLVSCLNLAAAILAQGLDRTRELTVRAALGATRGRIVRHLLAHALALAVPSSVLGLLLAGAGFGALQRLAPGTLPRLDGAALDPSAMAVAFAAAVLTACIGGLVPAVLLSRLPGVDRLRTHGAGTDSRTQRHFWSSFVSLQVALTVLLLAGTGLLVRSFLAASSMDVGYDARNVLAVDVTLPETRFANPASRVAYFDAVLERLRSAPGVIAAGVTNSLPHVTTFYTSTTYPEADDSRNLMAGYRTVDRGYFDALRIALNTGDIAALDSGAALVDTRVAALWRGGSPLGDLVVNGFAGRPLTVGGVVGQVREWHVREGGMGAVYEHYRARPERLVAMHLVVRHASGAAEARRAVADAVASVDAMVPFAIEPLAVRAAESLSGRRLILLLASAFGGIALLLASAGVYAMVSFAVGRQVRESAIRLALGAHPTTLCWQVVARGVVPAAAGVAVGLALALPLGTALEAQLFGVRPADPVVLLTVGIGVGGAAVLAAVLPARRTRRVNAAAVLRHD